MTTPAPRAGRGLVVAGLVTAALAAATAGALVWATAGQEPVRAGDGWFVREASAAIEGFAQSTASLQVAAVLAARDDALREHQPQRFLSDVAVASRPAQRRVYQRLAAAPFVRYRTQPRPGWLPDPAALTAGRLTVPVRLTTRLPGDPIAAHDSAHARFRVDGGRWRLVAVVPGHPQVWDLASVTHAQGSRSLVLAADGAVDPAALAAETDVAVAGVDRVWPWVWPARVVVVVPRTTGQLADLVGVKGSGEVAAITSFRGDSRGRVVRIQLNPEVFADLTPLARQILLRHEVAHAAQYGRRSDTVPVWLAEGVAEYLGYRDSGVPDAVIAADVLTDVRAGRLPEHLPASPTFAFAGGETARRLAYEQAWSVCRMLVDRYGEAALFDVYRQVSGRQGGSVGAALRSRLDVDRAELLAQWHAWLRSRA